MPWTPTKTSVILQIEKLLGAILQMLIEVSIPNTFTYLQRAVCNSAENQYASSYGIGLSFYLLTIDTLLNPESCLAVVPKHPWLGRAFWVCLGCILDLGLCLLRWRGHSPCTQCCAQAQGAPPGACLPLTWVQQCLLDKGSRPRQTEPGASPSLTCKGWVLKELSSSFSLIGRVSWIIIFVIMAMFWGKKLSFRVYGLVPKRYTLSSKSQFSRQIGWLSSTKWMCSSRTGWMHGRYTPRMVIPYSISNTVGLRPRSNAMF